MFLLSLGNRRRLQSDWSDGCFPAGLASGYVHLQAGGWRRETQHHSRDRWWFGVNTSEVACCSYSRSQAKWTKICNSTKYYGEERRGKEREGGCSLFLWGWRLGQIPVVFNSIRLITDQFVSNKQPCTLLHTLGVLNILLQRTPVIVLLTQISLKYLVVFENINIILWQCIHPFYMLHVCSLCSMNY